jgi:hypothetical protein
LYAYWNYSSSVAQQTKNFVRKKNVVSICAANVYPEMEHVREMRKGGVVEMVDVMEAECKNGCPRNGKEML